MHPEIAVECRDYAARCLALGEHLDPDTYEDDAQAIFNAIEDRMSPNDFVVRRRYIAACRKADRGV